MSKNNRKDNKAPQIPVESPAVEPQLTEVNTAAGLTPEQLAVAQALKPTGMEAEMKKERNADRLKKSGVQSPVKLVWALCDAYRKENPAISRKEILEKLIGNEIAFYTARTQYQAWKKATEQSNVDAAKAAEAKLAGELEAKAMGA